MSDADVLDRATSGGEKVTKHKHLGVAIITPDGTYPDEDTYKRVPSHEKIDVVLKQAAHALEITNTTDWIAKVGDRILDPQKTFGEEDLSCVVDVEYHKHEGGGGDA